MLYESNTLLKAYEKVHLRGSLKRLNESFFINTANDIELPSIYSILDEFEVNRMEVLGHSTDLKDFGGDVEKYREQLAKEFPILERSTDRFRMKWNLIPAQQYKYALEKFIKQGPELYRFPESTLMGWLETVVYNLEQIEIITELCGHEQNCDYDAVRDVYFDDSNPENEELGEKLIHDWESMYDFLDERGFGLWETLPDGTDAISDFGRRPIIKILDELPDAPSSAEMIVALNRCLDVAHCRGDLSSAFIEGGSNTLANISNG